MLNNDTALEVAGSCIRNAGGGEVVSKSQSLADLGFVSDETIQLLVKHIVEHVGGLQQRIESDKLSGYLKSSLTVAQLAYGLERNTSGKLCMNTKNPHEQKCCPYPEICPQCGYKVTA